jgi:hypothetical protein
MPFETRIIPTEVGLGPASSPTRTSKTEVRPGWVVGKLMLTWLLLVYLLGWVQEFKRIQGLEAEATPPSKVITKYEAWNRIYLRPIQ